MTEDASPIHICREPEIFGNIVNHFNNPEISDVTLKVGNESYHAHRFVLSVQSSVFQTMFMNGQWKESDQKVIVLEESPQCEKAVFEDFLKFLYTGKVALSSDQVCGIHMLADKYDVPSLKEEAVKVMEDVLIGEHCNAFRSSIRWLRHIEQFIPALLPVCYDAIRTNFYAIANCTDSDINLLGSRDLTAILTNNDVIVYTEMQIFEFVIRWAKVKARHLSKTQTTKELKSVLEVVRFYSIDADGLQTVENCPVCNEFLSKKFIADYVMPAYKVHSQMQCLASPGRKKSTGDAAGGGHKCPYDAGDECPHLNPRLYLKGPYGTFFEDKEKRLIPVDLADVEKHAKLQLRVGVPGVEPWKFKQDYPIEDRKTQMKKECFTLTPASSHVGRRYTVGLIAGLSNRRVRGGRSFSKYTYAIKKTGVVEQNVIALSSSSSSSDSSSSEDCEGSVRAIGRGGARPRGARGRGGARGARGPPPRIIVKPITLCSPARQRGFRDGDDEYRPSVGVTIHLH